MKKIKKITKKIITKTRLNIMAMSLAFMYTMPKVAQANAIKDSKVAKGTNDMFNDVTSTLVWLAPVVGGAFLGYNFFKASHAEDEEMRAIKKQRKVIIYSTVGVFLASIIITVVTSYYK